MDALLRYHDFCALGRLWWCDQFQGVIRFSVRQLILGGQKLDASSTLYLDEQHNRHPLYTGFRPAKPISTYVALKWPEQDGCAGNQEKLVAHKQAQATINSLTKTNLKLVTRAPLRNDSGKLAAQPYQSQPGFHILGSVEFHEHDDHRLVRDLPLSIYHLGALLYQFHLHTSAGPTRL